MPEETWKNVEHAPGYQVSDLGRVRTLDREVLGRDGRTEIHRGRVLRQQRMKNGYLEVYVCADGKRKHRTVHSLVADAFLGTRPEGYDVMHINGDRADNRVANLCYGSRSANLRSTYSYGGKQANGKLSLEDVDDIRARLGKGVGVPELAAEYRVHVSTIYHVRDRKSFAWYEGGGVVAQSTCASIPQ